MALQDKLLKAAKEPRRSYEQIAKVAKGAIRALLPREANGDIVMFHVGRSGSEVLGDMLDQHPRIYWDGEVFSSVIAGRSHPSDPIVYLNGRMRRAGPSRYGCEVKPFHIEHLHLRLEDLIQHLLRLGVSHYVVLERRNYLRKIVSSLIAHETGAFHRGVSQKRTRHRVTLDVERIRIDRDERSLLGLLESYDRFFQSLRVVLGGERVLWITYEEDVHSNPMIGYEKICSFVGIEPRRGTQIRYAKTNPYPLEDIVTNVADVRSALRGSGFEWMARDGTREDRR